MGNGDGRGTDPLRADLRPEAVTRAARRLAASMVAVVAGEAGLSGERVPVEALVPGEAVVPGEKLTGDDDGPSIAARLTAALSPSPTPEQVRGVNAALVLMADHELATSTMAVRIAASTRADIYDALLAGLGTIAGPLHGGASRLAYLLAGRRRAFRRSPGPGRDVALAGRASWFRSLGLQERGRPRCGVVRPVRVHG